MRPDSLATRLTLLAGAWLLLALLLAGAVLVWLFGAHIERRLDASLADHVEELVAAAEAPADGALVLSWQPFDPRFSRPLSGWYWQVEVDGRVAARSASLLDDRLQLPGGLRDEPSTLPIDGPDGEPLRVAVLPVSLPRSASVYRFAVAGPLADARRDVRTFTAQTAATLGVLALGLLLAMLAQVRIGLRPLAALRQDLADLHDGRRQSLDDAQPAEVRPMVDELNRLLARNAAQLERARASAADLAHALKNPLTVVNNETASLPPASGQVLREQVATMRRAIDYHLSRARAASHAGTPGQLTRIEPLLDDLCFSMRRIHARPGLHIEHAARPDCAFRGDEQDLAEMLGNLLDNACKWARQRVRVTMDCGDERVVIGIEDDGPGIPAAARERALDRGVRLDRSVPGSGIGLALVRDLADAYEGRLRLAACELGGLRAELRLPGSAPQPAAPVATMDSPAEPGPS